MEASVLHCVAMRGTFCRARVACHDLDALRQVARHAVCYLRASIGEVPPAKVNSLLEQHWQRIRGRYRVKCILENHARHIPASAQEAQEARAFLGGARRDTAEGCAA